MGRAAISIVQMGECDRILEGVMPIGIGLGVLAVALDLPGAIIEYDVIVTSLHWSGLVV
jgi:hypothetical protein